MRSLSIQEKKEVESLLKKNSLCDLLIFGNYIIDDLGSIQNLTLGYETILPYINRVSDEQEKQIKDTFGKANTLMLNLSKAKNYYVQTENMQKIRETFELAKLYGDYFLVKNLIDYGIEKNIKELQFNGDYPEFLKNDCLIKMRLRREGNNFSFDNHKLANIVRDIINSNGVGEGEEHLLFLETLKKLEKGHCKNVPKKLIYASLTKVPEIVEQYKDKFKKTARGMRSEIDAYVLDYIRGKGMKFIDKLQEGDYDDFFPIASHLYLVKEKDKFFVLKEHLQLYVDYSRINGYTNEKNILSNINHPHIIKLDDVVKIRGRDFLKLEYFKSKTLAEYTENHIAMPVNKAISVALKLAEVLDYLHQNKILYMDIKDKNVMYNGRSIKLLDFGMAQKFRRPIDDNTYARSLLSTPKYVTPEGGTVFKAYNKSDTFQLGILFYELLTGYHPFANNKYNLMEGDAHRESEIIKYSLPNICKSYDRSAEVLHKYPELDDLLRRMLHPTYRERPTPKEVKKELRGLKIK